MRAAAQHGLLVQGRAACSCVSEVVLLTQVPQTSVTASAQAAHPYSPCFKRLSKVPPMAGKPPETATIRREQKSEAGFILLHDPGHWRPQQPTLSLQQDMACRDLQLERWRAELTALQHQHDARGIELVASRQEQQAQMAKHQQAQAATAELQVCRAAAGKPGREQSV